MSSDEPTAANDSVVRHRAAPRRLSIHTAQQPTEQLAAMEQAAKVEAAKAMPAAADQAEKLKAAAVDETVKVAATVGQAATVAEKAAAEEGVEQGRAAARKLRWQHLEAAAEEPAAAVGEEPAEEATTAVQKDLPMGEAAAKVAAAEEEAAAKVAVAEEEKAGEEETAADDEATKMKAAAEEEAAEAAAACSVHQAGLSDKALVLRRAEVFPKFRQQCTTPPQQGGSGDGKRGHLSLQQMDTNNDGVVDAAEFAAAGGSKQEFDGRDLNGDGLLDADELSLSQLKQNNIEDIQQLRRRLSGHAAGAVAALCGLRGVG